MSGTKGMQFDTLDPKQLIRQSQRRQDIFNQIHESQKSSTYSGYEEDDQRKTKMLQDSKAGSFLPFLSFSQRDSRSQNEPRIGTERRVVELKVHGSVVTFTEVISDELQPDYLNMTMRKKWRWPMVVLCCLFVLGNYYSYDLPAALETAMEEELGVTPSAFGMLYSMYSMPNIVFPLLSGALQAKIGVRRCLLLFSGLCVVGQGLCALGNFTGSFTTILVGRAILGTGDQSLSLGQATLVSQWFINFELPAALGIIRCAPQLGEILNGFLSPMIYNLFAKDPNNERTLGFGMANLVAFIMQVVCFLLVILAIQIDIQTQKADEMLLRQYSQELKAKQKRLSTMRKSGATLVRSANEQGTERFSKSFKQAEDIKKRVSFKDITSIGVPFWFTLLSCVCVYIAVTNSIIVMPGLLQRRFGWSLGAAGALHPMPYAVATILTPLLGIWVHKYGHRMTVCVVGSLLLILSHALLPLIPSQPICIRCWESLMTPVLQGLTYAAYSVAMFGSIPYLVEARILGVAYGIALAAQNLGMLVSAPLAGYIKQETRFIQDGYYWVQMYFIAISCISLLANIIVWIYDKKKRDNILQSSEALEKFETYTEQTQLENGRKTLMKVDPELEFEDLNDETVERQREKDPFRRGGLLLGGGGVLCDMGIGTEEAYTETHDESRDTIEQQE